MKRAASIFLDGKKNNWRNEMPESYPIVNEIMDNAMEAAAIFSQYDQDQVDKIVRAVFIAGFNNRVRLAKFANEETGIGRWEDKVMKNVLATQYVYENIRHQKTAGIISEDLESGIIEIAQPLGPILAVIPVTNPTSTTLFKILIALKTRNPIIISAHHKALQCCKETVRICYEAALQADAPENCIIFFERGSREETKALMSDKRLALILATGGESVVKAAYSSGTPALGVGPGNVPVFIEKSADIKFASEQIFISKTFDNGTVCASEQALIVEKEISKEVEDNFKKLGAFFLEKDDIRKLGNLAYDKDKKVMNADIIGKSVAFIAERAGIIVPPGTKILVAKLDGVGPEYPLSSEILAPILAYYIVDSFDSAVNMCIDLNYLGGLGHTVSIFSNDEEKIKDFSMMMNAGRILVNMPSSQGAVGGTFSRLITSFTLGCGSGGKNITTDNVGAKHLLNIQRICRRRMNERMEHFDNGLYYDETLNACDIEKLYNKNY